MIKFSIATGHVFGDTKKIIGISLGDYSSTIKVKELNDSQQMKEYVEEIKKHICKSLDELLYLNKNKVDLSWQNDLLRKSLEIDADDGFTYELKNVKEHKDD